MAFATKSMDNELEYELVKFLKIIRAKDFYMPPVCYALLLIRWGNSLPRVFESLAIFSYGI